MGTLLRVMTMACLVFGFHYAVKRIAATAVTAQTGAPEAIAPLPASPGAVAYDSAELRRSLDRKIGQIGENVSRAAGEGAARQIDRLNRDAARAAAPFYPGIPRR
jgi:hypothetical protein